MKLLMLPFLLLSTFALASGPMAIELYSVGDYGGSRVAATCTLDKSTGPCLIDTASWFTILAATPEVEAYASLEKVSLTGLGSIAFECDRIEPDTFLVSGVNARENILRCPGFPPESSPMVGIGLFAGKSFSFSFANGQLLWASPARAKPAPLSLVGHHSQHISIPAQVGGVPARALFDTGAPVTMVSFEFLAAHPEFFRPSTLPRSKMMIRNKFLAYELTQPIVVEGVELSAQFVYAVDLRPIVSDQPFDLVLGVNHLAQADWFFDLGKLLFSVNK